MKQAIWFVLDDQEKKSDDYSRYPYFLSRCDMFDYYRVNTVKEWKDNIGWTYKKGSLIY